MRTRGPGTGATYCKNKSGVGQMLHQRREVSQTGAVSNMGNAESAGKGAQDSTATTVPAKMITYLFFSLEAFLPIK